MNLIWHWFVYTFCQKRASKRWSMIPERHQRKDTGSFECKNVPAVKLRREDFSKIHQCSPQWNQMGAASGISTTRLCLKLLMGNFYCSFVQGNNFSTLPKQMPPFWFVARRKILKMQYYFFCWSEGLENILT